MKRAHKLFAKYINLFNSVFLYDCERRNRLRELYFYQIVFNRRGRRRAQKVNPGQYLRVFVIFTYNTMAGRALPALSIVHKTFLKVFRPDCSTTFSAGIIRVVRLVVSAVFVNTSIFRTKIRSINPVFYYNNMRVLNEM